MVGGNVKMDVKIKLLTETAKIPTNAYGESNGWDLYADEETIIDPNTWKLVKTGIAIQLPMGFGGFVCSKSGLAIKHGIQVLNSPGLIDFSFIGEIGVIVKNNNTFHEFRVNRDKPIAQLVIMKTEDINFVHVDKLELTNRGERGFGSSSNVN